MPGYAYYWSYGVVMMRISAPERPAAIDPLTAARVGKELADLRLLRAVVRARAREQGRSQSAIAVKLGLTQPGVHKMLIRAGVTPEVGERTPWEVVLGYAAGEVTRDQMLATLAGWAWTVTSFPGEDGNPMSEAIERGSWEDVGRAVRAGYLSEGDYGELFERTA